MGNVVHPIITTNRKVVAFSVAAVSDAISFFTEFWPPLEWIVDGATVIVLACVLGFRWQLLLAMFAEAIPGVALFPSWIAAVFAILGDTPKK